MGKITVTAEDAIWVDSCLYFAALEINAICKINPSGIVDVIGKIPEEEAYANRVCSKILSVDRYLYFLPMNGKKIWVYSIDDMTWSSIEIECADSYDMKIMQGIVHKDKIILIGCFYPAIIIIDHKTKKTTYIREPYEELSEAQKLKGVNFFRCDYALRGDKVYIASCVENKVLIFDMTTYQWFFSEIGDKSNAFSGIAWDDDCFWLSPKVGNRIIRWDGYNNTEEYLIENENCGDNFRFTGVLRNGKEIIFPAKDGEYTYIFSSENKSCLSKERKRYLFYKMDKGDNIIAGTHDGSLCVEKTKGVLSEIRCLIDIDQLKDKLEIEGCIYQHLFYEEKKYLTENHVRTLEKYLLYLCDKEV